MLNKSIYQSIYHIFSICENILFIHAYIVRWVYSIRVIIKLDELTINRHQMISIDTLILIKTTFIRAKNITSNHEPYRLSLFKSTLYIFIIQILNAHLNILFDKGQNCYFSAFITNETSIISFLFYELLTMANQNLFTSRSEVHPESD